jgi:hypothetical protein
MRFDIPYQRVNLSSDRCLIPEIDHDGPIITNGSVLLSKIAVERGWTPGSLLNDNFSYEIWHPILRDYLLNRDAVFTTIRDADPVWDSFFIRPLADSKSFNGKVIGLNQFRLWQQRVVVGNDKSLSPETPMLCAPVRKIGQEIRHYIVDGEVISSSRYKLNGQTSETEVYDSAVLDFARDMATIWSPARAFVLDTYISGTEMGIVEMGCICHAGLYQADVQKVVMSLDGMI